VIKLLILFFAILPAYSASELKILISEPVVQQGEILEVTLLAKAEDLKGLELQKLKNERFADTIYFLQISPLMSKVGNDYLEAQARLVFTQVPKTNQLSGKLGENNVSLTWNRVEIAPTEAAKDLIFGSFEIPRREQFLFWTLLILALLIPLGVGGWYIFKNFKNRRLKKDCIARKKAEVLNCRSYDDIVQLWKKKHEYFQLFPHLVEPFQKLEMVLNKHQFKPQQSEEDKKEILDSYRKFSHSVEGGFLGI
jgi:hypothetical protein